MKRALLTGITGQDGSYLCELLLAKGYEVHGLIRRSSAPNTARIEHLCRDPKIFETRLFLRSGDLTNGEQLRSLIEQCAPEEIYHLAGQSHVQVSFEIPEYTGTVVALGALRLLDAVRRSGIPARVYNAASSEMFGASQGPQDEATPFHPCNPYAAAKLYGYWMARIYREGYGLFACNGILFNHESPRRGETFVTRKITRSVARIVGGLEERMSMGNVEASRDWGYAPEYVEAMWKILQQQSPDDYVIGTGQTHTVREFLEAAFAYVGLDWQRYVVVDPKLFRPVETGRLVANCAKAERALGWSPRIGFQDLVRIMVDADLEALGLSAPGEGKRIVQERLGEWHRWQGAIQESLAGSSRETA